MEISLPRYRFFTAYSANKLNLNFAHLLLAPHMLLFFLSRQEPVWKPDAYTPEEEVPKRDAAYLDTKDVDELEELEDDFSDDRFLEDYRRKRIEELKKGTTRPRFGTLETIRASEFVAQVTNAGEDVWVVCHLFKDAVAHCGILNACLTELSERYPNTKFVKIISTECIPGYPDENLPTILLYHNSKCIHTLVGLAAVGGEATSPDRVAMALNCYGPVCGDSEQDAQQQVRNMVESLLVERAAAEAAKGGGGAGNDEDEDSDFD
jgi:Phosducin